MTKPPWSIWLRSPRRLVGMVAKVCGVTLCLVAYLFATIGMPVTMSASKKSNRPFPCQDHACGCVDADECWRHCCCFTPAQKVAWAKAHGVTPPDFVVAAAQKSASQQSCCHHADDDHDHDHEHAPTAPACCCCQKSCCAPAPTSCCSSGKSPTAKVVTGWVITEQYRTCKGLPMLWVGLGAVLPPPALCEVPRRPVEIEHRISLTLLDAQFCLGVESPPPQSV